MKDHTAHPWIGLVFACGWIVFGYYLFRNSYKLRQRQHDDYIKHPLAKKLNPFYSMTETPGAIVQFKIAGVLAMLSGILLLLLLTMDRLGLPPW